MANTLDEALDEFDRWGEQLSKELEQMTPEEQLAYLNGAEETLEKLTGVNLHLKHVAASNPAAAMS